MGRIFSGFKTVLIGAACVALGASTSSAASLTGNPATDGWTHGGNSLAAGVYVNGSENIGFDLYTTSFKVQDSAQFSLAGHDGSSYPGYYLGASESGYWDTSTARVWEVGQTVMGIGGVFNTISAGDAGWSAFTGVAVNSTIDNEDRFRLQAKIGTDPTWTTSTVAPGGGDGNGSTSAGGPGAFLVRTSGWHTQEAWEGFSGEVMGLQKRDHIDVGSPDVARIVWTYDETANRPASWEILVNLSLLSQETGIDYLSVVGQPVIGSVQIGNLGYTNGLVVVPEPGALGVAALAGLALLARRPRRKATA